MKIKFWYRKKDYNGFYFFYLDICIVKRYHVEWNKDIVYTEPFTIAVNFNFLSSIRRGFVIKFIRKGDRTND